MHRPLQTATKPLTIDLVEWFLDIPQYVGDRIPHNEHIKWLQDEISKGTFHSPTWDIAVFGDEEIRVNGNHNAMALRKASCDGQTLPSIDVVIRYHLCESTEDLAALWVTFDNKKSLRTRDQVMHAGTRTVDVIKDLGAAMKNKIGAGIHYAVTKGSTAGTSDQERIKLVTANACFTAWAAQHLGRNGLRGASVIAAMFETFEAGPTEAAIFWGLTVKDSHPDKNHPTSKLHKLFLRAQGKLEKQSNTEVDLSPFPLYARSIIAWDAYIEGKPTDLRYYHNTYYGPLDEKTGSRRIRYFPVPKKPSGSG